MKIETIKNNEMLTDLVVDRCWEILKSQYRKHYKLQDSVLGQKLMFKEKKEELVQILINESYHLLFVSNASGTKNEISYLLYRKIKYHVKIQICNILQIL